MARSGDTYEQLATAFRHRNFKPLYFLYGEETFLIDELQRLLVDHALAPHERDFNLDLVYGNEVDAPTVLALCGSYPVMAERRVVIVRQFEQLNRVELFKSYAAVPNPASIVFLACSRKPNLSRQPYRALKAEATWMECKPLYDRQIPGWIAEQVRARGRKIEPAAVQMLAQFTGTSLRSIDAELRKLITYAGARTTLTEADVLDVGGHSREFNVFELQRAIGKAKFVQAMQILERMLQITSNKRGTALMIVSVLTGYFVKLRKLTGCQERRVSEKGMAERIGVPVFFIKEYRSSLRTFAPAALERAFSALLAADYELKGGTNRDEELILTLLLRRLIPGEA